MKKYAICGFSNRCIGHFAVPLIGNPKLPEYGNFSNYGKLVAILDVDEERVQTFNENQGTNFPYYPADALDRMIQETKPDVVIVTSPDMTHAEFIIGALKHDIDVITEKPMVIDCQQAKAVIDAERNSNGSVRVTHNYRYTPSHKLIKRMIMDGKLGRITNIEMVYNLDTFHGASFFWRWNRDRSKSGGVTISKCCHHFDLVNWWLDDFPEQVFAYGALNYYGWNSPYNPCKNNNEKYSVKEQKTRCPYHKRWFSREMAPPKDDHIGAYEKAFKLPYNVQYPPDVEPLYIYDPEIDIEDTYSAVIRYRKGASMTYSANYSAPWEGYTLAINGTGGRLETTHYTSPSRCPFPVDSHQSVTYIPLFGERQVWNTRNVKGGHGGADEVMKWDMFAGVSEESRELGIFAGTESGAYAVAVGELIWRSVKENRPMDVPTF